jgi:hypothetical protein
MNWLRAHEYLAVWVVLLLAGILRLIQNYKAKSAHKVGRRKMVAYLSFLICICVALIPVIDEGVRLFAGSAAMFMLAFFIVDSYNADGSKH